MQLSTIIFWSLITIFSLDFIFDRLLSLWNQRSWKSELPKEFQEIYDKEKYQTARKYSQLNSRLAALSSILSFLTISTALIMGWFGNLDAMVNHWFTSPIPQALAFFGILAFISSLMSLPFSIYSTFVIEEKFGFNKTTVKTFVLDKLKGYLLTIIFGGLILGTLIYLVFSIGSNFWIYFWIIISTVMVFLNMFYTSLIVPIFNKLTPLEDGSLKSAIESYANTVAFPLTNVFVIDGSKRSSKGNAFFSGLGKKKKVVLYDTLIEKHSDEELVAVLAHEVGHFKKKHIIWSMILGILQTGITLFLLSLMIFNSEVSWAMGGNVSAMHLNMLAFGILYSPLSSITGIFMNILSRKNEYEADAFAVTTYKRQPLVDGLKRLTSDSLGNLTPHPWYVFMNYSHPTLLQRIEAMESVK